MCCVLPMGVWAEPAVIEPAVGDGAVSVAYDAWQDAIDNGQSVVITGGAGIDATGGTTTGGNTVNPGFAVANNMIVGLQNNPGTVDVPPIDGKVNNLYVLNSANQSFTVVSTGDVSIGAMLQVLGDTDLAFKTSDSNPSVFDLSVGDSGIILGGGTGSSALSMDNIDALTVTGQVQSYGNFTVNANSVDVGAIYANAGNLNITSGTTVAMDRLLAQADVDSITVTAGTNITSAGDVQNIGGDMTLVADNDINIQGNFENKSASNVTVSGADFVVAGTMTNESSDAKMVLNLDNWRIEGGASNIYSFVNNGGLKATVSGETYMEYGMNLSGMSSDDVFDLTTGQLSFGQNASSDAWIAAFANNLDSFNVNVTNGDLSLATVVNGVVGTDFNQAANMTVNAQNLVADSVINNAGMLFMGAGQDLTINGAVTGNAGTTKLVGANKTTVDGAITNMARMIVNGATVNVDSLSNSGTVASLTVASQTGANGPVNVGGNVTNTDGTTTIWAKNVDINGVVVNSGGTTEIRGSDLNGGAVSIGALNVAGGVVNLNALAGNVEIDGALTVSGGALNLREDLSNLVVGGSVQIAGDLTASDVETSVANNVNIAAGGSVSFGLSAQTMSVGGDVSVTDASLARSVTLDALTINIAGDASVANMGYLKLGATDASTVGVVGDLTANNGGVFESFADKIQAASISGNSVFKIHGANITANAGNIDIDGNIYFDAVNDPTTFESGMVVRDTTSLTMETSANDADILVDAVSVGNGNTLKFVSTDEVNIGGVLVNYGNVDVEANGAMLVTGLVTNTGNFDVVANNVQLDGINNTGTGNISSDFGAINTGDITTGGNLTISSATNVVAGTVSQTAGVTDITASQVGVQSLGISGAPGTRMDIDAPIVKVAGGVNVSGDLVQGGTGGMLNVNATDFSADSLTIGGNFIASYGDVEFDIDSNVSVDGDINVADGVNIKIDAGNRINATDLINAGNMGLVASQGIKLANVTNNSGVLDVYSGTDWFDFSTLTMNGGNLVLHGAGLNMTGVIDTGANLYQNWGGVMADNDINVVADDYVITTGGLDVAGINQNGKLVINTSSVNVSGDINANDLQFIASPNGNWMNVDIANGGSIFGNVDFIGLEKMTVDGNYVFNDNSKINAAILPHVAGGGINASGINYWASVSLNDDETLGQITNATYGDVRALITVGGKFESELNTLGNLSSGGQLGQPQIGIDIFDIIDQGTAIWFLHAQEGVSDLAIKIRNLNVSFCNADGSICMDYLPAISRKDTDADSVTDVDVNGTDQDLPAYVSVRDVDNDGVSDSLYIVFDPRFGGPVQVFKIQPIVVRAENHTKGEYVSAGALDNMIAGQLINKKFFNRTPIEVIPLIFEGTNLATMANELYNRMEDYVQNRDGDALARFSRLFQVREIEQIAGVIALNEHTAFRSFEDRMFDEFIWNRNRNLKKAWLDVDYGMFYQNIDDGKHTDGHRFSVAAGFDWQKSNTLQLGVTGRVSRTTSKTGDSVNLGFAGTEQFGDVEIDVVDTNVGFGGYLMKTLGTKARLYANAFVDLHMIDVNRIQNFVDEIDGDGSAFSFMSEWGLMHDILNQYVVGNLYARLGYNFGFNVTEQAAGDDYMRLKSDGYFALTPGYSLIAQKRIYPSAWFQIRPYASIGIEYDVLGAPDFAKYKFVVADDFTEYDIDIDPLWANIGGGVEMLSAHGVQFGIDYRYQYNNALQLHNIKVSGSYRF